MLYKNKANMVEFIKFVIIGTIATGIHYSIYLLLDKYIGFNISYSLGYALSFIFNYVASNYFTFKTKPSADGGIKFIGAHVFNYFLQIALLNIYVMLGIPKLIAPFFVYCICVPTNYFLVKKALKK